MRLRLKMTSEMRQKVTSLDLWSVLKTAFLWKTGGVIILLLVPPVIFVYIGQTRRWLKYRIDGHYHKVRNEEVYNSSIADPIIIILTLLKLALFCIVVPLPIWIFMKLFTSFKTPKNLLIFPCFQPLEISAWKLLV